MSRPSFRVVTDAASLASLAASWEELAPRNGFDDVFATYEFARAWWETYGSGSVLRVVVGERDARTRLIAPFYAMAADEGVWRLIGDPRADYSNFIYDASEADLVDAMLDWLAREGGWKEIRLRRVPESAPLATARRVTVRRSVHAEHPRIDQAALSAFGALPDRESHRKQARWFERQRPLRFERIAARDALRDRLPAFFALHEREWGHRGDASMFTDPAHREFYSRLVDGLSAQSAVHLDRLLWGDQLIAAHFGFHWRGREYYYKPCFDPELGAHSPGRLLLEILIARAASAGAREFDLLYGAEAYKLKYASDVRRTVSARLYRSYASLIRARIAHVIGR